MKYILFILAILPFFGRAQYYNASAADKFVYKEIVDTIFINNTFLVPGDTLQLGNGSAPDKTFMSIYDAKSGSFFNPVSKHLSKEMSNTYLIYKERKRNKNRFFTFEQFEYSPIFYNPKLPDKYYKISWFGAIENHEIILQKNKN